MKKRSVYEHVRDFCGWETLSSMIEKLGAAKPEFQERNQGLFATLFNTGGRIMEVLLLTYKNFDFKTNNKLILVKGMIVQKQKARLHRGGVPFRTFPISRKEPLVPYMVKWVERFADKPDARIFNFTPRRAEQICKLADPEIYPHWFRAQRACQLAYDYEFDHMQLMGFFGWKAMKTALIYAKIGSKGLGKRMIEATEGGGLSFEQGEG